MNDPYTFDHIAASFVAKAAGYVAHRYRLYSVEREDVQQELYLWLYGDGRERVNRWLSNEPQQTTRIYRSLLDQGIRYAENEKAAKAGYRPDDVWWYTPNSVESLLPLVLDETFTQDNGHIGELITMVVDIRRAIKAAGLREFFAESDDADPDWRINLQSVVDQLGGERPAIGRRRAISNAHAQFITATQGDGA